MMKYCPYCMEPDVTGDHCPKCGRDLAGANEPGMQLPVGTRLSGEGGLRRYWLGAVIGMGGFGITYRAIEITSQQRVAIKEYFPTSYVYRDGDGHTANIITGKNRDFQKGRAGFLTEARMLLAQTNLPSVVHVIDFFEANGTAYLVMEYLDGQSLREYVKKQGHPIPAQKLLRKLRPVIRDLGVLHKNGYLHRDIAPDNLMWMPDGSIKVVDFGSARRISATNMTEVVKRGFSPIEQYSADAHQGPYTDIYALSATIYYCTTGTAPPDAQGRAIRDTLRAPTDLGADLTPEQESAILWGLSFKPGARPQSIQDFYLALYPKNAAQDTSPAKPVSAKTAAKSEKPPVQKPASPKPASKKKTPSFPKYLLALLAVVVVSTLLRVILYGGGKDPAVLESTPVSAQTPPEGPTENPTAQPTPADGNITADGFTYEIVNGAHAVLTGYTGTETLAACPEEIDGAPVTEIADGAFAGAPFAVLRLPSYLEHLGSKVFQGCGDLRFVIVYSDFSMEADSFAECGLQDILIATDVDTAKWSGEYQIFKIGLKTGIGTVLRYYATGNSLYGITDQNEVVLLDIVGAESRYTVVKSIENTTGEQLPVTWIDDYALERIPPETLLTIPDNCLFSPSLYAKAQWQAKEGTLADMWLYTNELAQRINAGRPDNAPAIVPDTDVMLAALERAQESIELFAYDRPDGTDSATALTDRNIQYVHTRYGHAKGNPRSSDIFHTFVEQCITPVTDSASRVYGQYHTYLGAAFYPDPDPASGAVTYYIYYFACMDK